MYRIGPRSEVGRRTGAKSGEVFSRLEGGGRRAEADEKGRFYFPLGPLKQQLFRHFLKNQLNCRWANYELTIVSVNLKENGQREREREKQKKMIYPK